MRNSLLENTKHLTRCFFLILPILASQGLQAAELIIDDDTPMAFHMPDAVRAAYLYDEPGAQILLSPPPPPKPPRLTIPDFLPPILDMNPDRFSMAQFGDFWIRSTLSITNSKLDETPYEVSFNGVFFPGELIVCIFSFLEARDLGRMSLVSKSLRRVIGTENSLQSIIWGFLIEKSRSHATISETHEDVPLLRFIRVRFGDYDTDAFQAIYARAKEQLASKFNQTIDGGYTMETKTVPNPMYYYLRPILSMQLDITQFVLQEVGLEVTLPPAEISPQAYVPLTVDPTQFQIDLQGFFTPING